MVRTRSLPQRRSYSFPISSKWRRRWSASGSATADRKRNVLTPPAPPLPCPVNPSLSRTNPPATVLTWYGPAWSSPYTLMITTNSCLTVCIFFLHVHTIPFLNVGWSVLHCFDLILTLAGDRFKTFFGASVAYHLRTAEKHTHNPIP